MSGRLMKLNKNQWNFLLPTILGLALWLIWGNFTIAESHFTITDKNIPESFDGFKIAHLSDIHGKTWGRQTIEPITEFDPNIIVITGDLIDSSTADFGEIEAWLGEITEIGPVYFITGNHEAWHPEYEVLEELLLENEVTVLKDEAMTLTSSGEEIGLIGLVDPAFLTESNMFNEHEFIMDAKIKELVDGKDTYNILLSHRPELFAVYVNNAIDFVLSGHAHGGQFRLPLIGGLVAPDQGFFPEYTAGLYEEEGTKMLVSRGLGNSIIPVRFNNRAELIFIELVNVS